MASSYWETCSWVETKEIAIESWVIDVEKDGWLLWVEDGKKQNDQRHIEKKASKGKKVEIIKDKRKII